MRKTPILDTPLGELDAGKSLYPKLADEDREDKEHRGRGFGSPRTASLSMACKDWG